MNFLEIAGRKLFSFKDAIMGQAIFILVVFQVLVSFNRLHLPPDLIPSAKMKIRKEEQPMQSLPHCQEIPRFTLHGRYSIDILAQHSRLIDISHSSNGWESSPVRFLISLAIHQNPAIPRIPHRKKFHHHTTYLNQLSPQCC